MTAPEQAKTATDTASASTSALVENAGRLGLKWDLRPATVMQADPVVTIMYDGDTAIITAVSMIGDVNAGDRVYVIFVPPSGNFITGRTGTSRTGARMRRTPSQALPNAAATTIIWNTLDGESGGDFIAIPATNIVVPTAGTYAISYTMSPSGVGGTRNFVTINVSSIVPGTSQQFRTSYDPGEALCAATAVIPLAARDTFSCDAFQNSGGAQTMTAALFVTRVAD